MAIGNPLVAESWSNGQAAHSIERLGITENIESNVAIDHTETATKQMISKITCQVCQIGAAKYKCPRCRLPFCSAKCSTIHKTSHPVSDPTTRAVDDTATSPSVPNEQPKPFHLKSCAQEHSNSVASPTPFSTLGESEELKRLFVAFPQLRSQLKNICASAMRPLGDNALLHRNKLGYVPGKDSCEGYLNGGGDSQSQRNDTEAGLRALRVAMAEHGELGEGIREYANLVLQTVANSEDDIKGVIESQIAGENARLVTELLRQNYR